MHNLLMAIDAGCRPAGTQSKPRVVVRLVDRKPGPAAGAAEGEAVQATSAESDGATGQSRKAPPKEKKPAKPWAANAE